MKFELSTLEVVCLFALLVAATIMRPAVEAFLFFRDERRRKKYEQEEKDR